MSQSLVDLDQVAVQRRNATLRTDAAITYISDPKCDSLDKLAKDARFADRVSRRTLERWCAEDNWVLRRQAFLRETYAEMRRRAADTLTQAMMEDVRMLIDVRQRAHELLMSEAVQPRSYEGLLKSFVDLSRRLEEVAGTAAERLVPGGMTAETAGPTDELPSGVSAEELDAMTRAALSVRRGELESGTPTTESSVAVIPAAGDTPAGGAGDSQDD